MGGADRAVEMEAILARGGGVDTLDISSLDDYSEGLLRRLADRHQDQPGITVVPTIGYHYRVHAFDRDPRLLETPAHFDFLNPAEKAYVLSSAKQALEKDGFIVKSRREYPGIGTRFRKLLDSGAPLAMGTDVGSAAHFHGGAIWWELSAWRAFGATSRLALTAATATAARVLRDERAGGLKEGAYADFVLYTGDVEQGRFALERVRAVGKDGVLFVRDGRWVGE
jgi:hypothetical protein